MFSRLVEGKHHIHVSADTYCYQNGYSNLYQYNDAGCRFVPHVIFCGGAEDDESKDVTLAHSTLGAFWVGGG